MKSIEQARAKFAWKCESRKHSSVVDKTPAYIKANGLLNTMAFFYSKPGEGKGQVLKDMCKWLTGSQLPEGIDSYPIITEENLSGSGKIEDKVIQYLLSAPAREVVQCTTEILAWINWLRRFAKS